MFAVLLVTLSLLLFVFCSTSNAQRAASTGWDKIQFEAWKSMTFNQAGASESFAYQESTGNILIGNLATGGMSSIPFSNAPTTIAASMTPVVQTNNPTNYSSFGIGVDFNYPSSGVFYSVGNYNNPPVANTTCAIKWYNISSTSTGGPQNNKTYTFPHSKNNMCLIDDIIQCPYSKYVYGTDFFGYRILKLTYDGSGNSYTPSVLSDLGGATSHTLLCSDPEYLNCGKGMSVNNGPNGIVIWNDFSFKMWLLINVDATVNTYTGAIIGAARLIKMNVETGNATEVMPGPNTPSGAFQGVNGMTIYNWSPTGDRRSNVVYAVGKMKGTTGTVQVLTSVDGWAHYEMRTVMSANCPSGSFHDTAVRMAGQHLLVSCNNNFDGGLQQMNMFFGFNQFSATPVAIPIATIFTESNVIPESFSYDPNKNMLVLGSIVDGGVRGWPYNNAQAGSTPITLNQEFVYASPSQMNAAGIYDVNGVNVNPNDVFMDAQTYVPVYNANCYAMVCTGGFSCPAEQTCKNKLTIINLCNQVNPIVQSIDLPGAQSANDVACLMSAGQWICFVTDTLGNQVFGVQFDITMLASGKPLSNPQVVVASSKGVIAPDGITAVPDQSSLDGSCYILISQVQKTAGQSLGIWKFEPKNSVLTPVSDATGIFSNIDGMKFNQYNNLLFGTRNSMNGTEGPAYESVVVAYSCDDWQSLNLVYSFQTVCPTNATDPTGTNPPAIALIAGLGDLESLVVLCNGGFSGYSHYNVSVVNDVNTVITNNQFNFCNFPQPTGAPTTSVDSSSSESYESSYNATLATTIVFAVLFFALAIYHVHDKFFAPRSQGMANKEHNANL